MSAICLAASVPRCPIAPNVSTAVKRFTRALWLAINHIPRAKAMVATMTGPAPAERLTHEERRRLR